MNNGNLGRKRKASTTTGHKKHHNTGGVAGKSPSKKLKNEVSKVKHKSGSAAPHGKKGGIIRRPKPKI